MKIWDFLDCVSTTADHRSRHNNSTDRRRAQTSERRSKDSHRSKQSRILTRTEREGVPTGKMTFSYSPPDHTPPVGVSKGGRLLICCTCTLTGIRQFKTENSQRTKQHMISRHGRQTWHARSPGYTDVPGYNILRLYVAVRKKESRNSFAQGLNDPPPLPTDCKHNLPGGHHRHCTWSMLVTTCSNRKITAYQGDTPESEFT